MRQFSVGEVVTWIPDLLLRSETHGDYKIVATSPIEMAITRTGRKRGSSCQIEWLFARTDPRAGVAP